MDDSDVALIGIIIMSVIVIIGIIAGIVSYHNYNKETTGIFEYVDFNNNTGIANCCYTNSGNMYCMSNNKTVKVIQYTKLN